MINKKILVIRGKLDKLDNQFLNLIKKRTNLVNKILKNKKYKKDIVDKKRIGIILKNISKKSKLKLKKYNPNTRKHEYFVEKKLPPHSK